MNLKDQVEKVDLSCFTSCRIIFQNFLKKNALQRSPFQIRSVLLLKNRFWRNLDPQK